MAERTEIAWCDSTFNPWFGCTKVGPGCDHCYAEALMDTRHRRAEWGAGKPRVRTSTDNWKAPLAWNSRSFYECLKCGHRFAPASRKEGYVACPICTGRHDGRAYDFEGATPVKEVRRRVFCASLADVFDNEVDPVWRADLLMLIRATPNLDYLLLTKRVGNVMKLLLEAEELLKAQDRLDGWDWLHDWTCDSPPHNVWLGATVVNQDEADRDIPKLLAIPARVRFLSVEPMLGPVTLDYTWLYPPNSEWPRQGNGNLISWCIVGGESGHQARPMHPDWVRGLRDQCHAADVPFHFKQHGEWKPIGTDPAEAQRAAANNGGEVRCYSWPDGETLVRVGKKAAGRLLDGREWDGFPA